MTHVRRLARYIEVPLSSAQRERNWDAIREHLPAAPRRSRAIPVLSASVLALAVVFGLQLFFRLRTPAIEGALLETRVDEQETLTLNDGSQLVVEGSTKLRLASISAKKVRLELDHGGIDAEVTHVDGRSFTVAVGAVEVAVVGTHFEVQTDGEGDARTVRVTVSHGRVRVTRSGAAPQFVDAGQSLTSTILPLTRTAPPTVNVAATADAGAARASAPVDSHYRLSRTFHQFYDQARYADAYGEIDDDVIEKVTENGTSLDLFQVAQTARWSGHPAAAADLFEALTKNYPEDSRAGLAALEIGRLRLNELNDPAGAVAAFDLAMQIAPSGPFREDAEARRIQALEATGDLASCLTARDSYLRDHPGGTHAVTVAKRCASP